MMVYAQTLPAVRQELRLFWVYRTISYTMTATAHALIAGAIAAKFHNPALAATLSFSSHFIIDAIPHWDVGTNWRKRDKKTTGALALIDTTFGMAISTLIYSPVAPLPLLLLTIIAALIPDWLETPWYIFFAKADKHEPGPRAGFLEVLAYKLYKSENGFHAKAQFPFGLFTQIATVAFFLILLK